MNGTFRSLGERTKERKIKLIGQTVQRWPGSTGCQFDKWRIPFWSSSNFWTDRWRILLLFIPWTRAKISPWTEYPVLCLKHFGISTVAKENTFFFFPCCYVYWQISYPKNCAPRTLETPASREVGSFVWTSVPANFPVLLTLQDWKMWTILKPAWWITETEPWRWGTECD